jgi:hypothetical protein
MAWPTNRSNPDLKWKIWYHDPNDPNHYNTFSNQDGPPRDAPTHGVVCIVQTCDGGRSKDMWDGQDYYIIDEEGKWIGVSQHGIDDRDARGIPYRALKHGRTVNTDRYQEIRSRAHNDPDFGGMDRAILVDELNEMVDRRPIRRRRRE